MARRFFAILSLLLVTTGALASTADAQVLGTFRWQLAPHCNVLTLTVEQRGAGYRLDGTDDLCGAPVQAAASGTAHLNTNGIVSIAVAVTRPDGNAIHQSLSVILPGLSGIWTDDVGNRGSLIFAPAAPAAGSPRQIHTAGELRSGFSRHRRRSIRQYRCSGDFVYPGTARCSHPARRDIPHDRVPRFHTLAGGGSWSLVYLCFEHIKCQHDVRRFGGVRHVWNCEPYGSGAARDICLRCPHVAYRYVGSHAALASVL